MRRFPRRSCAPLALLLGCVAALLGCATREDRTITFSADGDRVAFQHGDEGVFVADKEGGALTKIFTPDKGVIAVGTPLWAPNDRRLIFTTACPPPGGAAAPSAEPEPAGRLFVKQPVVYTCWLRDEPKGDANPEPRRLFTAEVTDVGYVAAGLAVRWHPKGDRVLYVERDGASHAVSEFDLATKKTRRVSPDVQATDMVFDWSPDGTRLAYVAGGTRGGKDDGLWIGGEGDWWHVAESAPVGAGVESVRAARPAWTKDDLRFAFVTPCSGQQQVDPAPSSLWIATIEDRRVRRILEETRPLRDLAWHPDGHHLGFVAGAEQGALRVTDLEHDPLDVTDKPVRGFAGWDAGGRFLAYTTADAPVLPDERGMSLLLFADPLARDALWVAPGSGGDPGRKVLSGLRTTFVRWSPTEPRLSQWFTFSPTHRSLISRWLDNGLRRGDPAATIDAETGAVSWMAVNADEMAQVGNHRLRQRRYDEAWSWYERAERAPKPAPSAPRPGARARFRDPSLFQSYCLEKLGRDEEAGARLATFRAKAPALLPAEGSLLPAAREVGTLAPVARDFYAAEVFLSLDAAEDGEAFFRRALAGAETDADRLSAAVVLSQLLLLRGRDAEYADLATETIAPLLLRAWRPRKDGEPDDLHFAIEQPWPVIVGSLSLAPLVRPDLLAAIPRERLSGLAARWAEWRDNAPDDTFRLGADLVLERLYRKLGRDADMRAARERIRAIHPDAGPVESDEEIMRDYKDFRAALDSLGNAVLGNRRFVP
jgi:hypothetical protein